MTIEKQAEELYPREESGMYIAYREAYIKGFKDANKWVDCKDRLPDEIGNYLVFNDNEIYLARFSPIPQDETGCTKEQNSNAKYWWINENTQYSQWAEKFTGHDSNDTLLTPSHWQSLPSTDSINLK
jgi:hypothetical protein